MKLEVLWMDGIKQEWEVFSSIYSSDILEYYLKDNCIDFVGKKIQPKGLKSDTIERNVMIPFQSVRWFEVLEK